MFYLSFPSMPYASGFKLDPSKASAPEAHVFLWFSIALGLCENELNEECQSDGRIDI